MSSFSHRRVLSLLALAAFVGPAAAQNPPIAVGEAPDRRQHDVGFEQKLGAKIPLDLTFTDENKTEVTLRDCIGGKPSILVLAYYRCPMLCGEVLAGVLDASKRLKQYTIGKEFNVVTVSFDPKEQPELALAKKRHFVNEYGRKEADEGWKFLTTKNKKNIDELTAAVGFRYEFDKMLKEYNHASGIMIVTPEGVVSRYMPGIEYFDRDEDGNVAKDPAKSLRLALVDAGDGQIGTASDRAFLTCYRYNPHTGKYSFNVKRAVQAGGILTMLVLGFVVIREFRSRRNRRVIETAGNSIGPKTELDPAI